MDSALDFSMKRRQTEEDTEKGANRREVGSSGGGSAAGVKRSIAADSSKMAATPPSSSCMAVSAFSAHSPSQHDSKPLLDMLRYGSCSNPLDVMSLSMSAALHGVMRHPCSPIGSLALSPGALGAAASTVIGSGAGGQSLIKAAAESTLFPMTSLAMSTLHRRRRSNSSNVNDGSGGDNEVESSSKKPKCVPDSKKDVVYWQRRRKNNEAAKRSRDMRRAKEEEIALRAAYLEQENLKLKAQVNVLKTETARLHCMLFSHVQTVVSC